MTEFFYWNLRRPLQRLPYWIAAKMPRWLVYHCAIRLFAHATCGKYSATLATELTAMEAMNRWEAGPNV